ncbi:MAG: hypothetical protein QOD61_2736 [Solirubrobacteraceae bacterium]|nr:hypothetical protein [Solirubrobacteraceae bacterium]
MDRAADERLSRLLGAPELVWLVDRVRRRLELGQGLDGTVTLAGATVAQRQAVHRLLGRPPRSGRAVCVSLPALDAVIRGSGACAEGLAGASARLAGPVTTRAETALALSNAWKTAFGAVEAAVGAAGRTGLEDWLGELRESGLVKRLEPDPRAAGVLLDRLAVVVAGLPADGEPIGRFASRVAGGAHALDDGEPLATLAIGAARALSGLPTRQPGESPAAWRREVWAAVGLVRDELSSLVLCAGLPGDPVSVTGRILAAGTDDGQPVALTLRQMMTAPAMWGGRLRDRTVRVCENPVVVQMAADRLGRNCPPLVCTSGQPGAAVMSFLDQVVKAGGRLSHHGDFDWGGLRIGNVLHARLPIGPWRFDASAYEQAVAADPGPPLRGAPTMATWDVGLTAAMLRIGYRVEEESVAEHLLDDLESTG